VALAASLAAAFAGCALKKTSDPAPIDFQVGFPSVAAAIGTDSVVVYVFLGAQVCNDLIRLRQTGQELPASLLQTPALTPCALMNRQGTSFDLDLNNDYTMLAVGEAGGRDQLIGCTVQRAFGTTQALNIPMTFIDNKQSLATTKCTKLSDKCGGAACQ
jgi:hypothetical protein